MAAAAVTTTAPGASQRFASPMMNVAFVPITITASTTTYTTATGGLPFDLFAFLASVGPMEAPVSYKDVIGIIATSTTGYVASALAIGTVTSTTVPATVRLWTSGTSEVADGNNSQTIIGWLLIARGGTN